MRLMTNRRELFVAAGAAALLAACDRRGQGATQYRGVIGVLTPLTGDGAVYGRATRNGIDLAVEEINAAGGVRGQPLRVVYEDDKIDPAEGVSAFQRLVAAEHPSVVLGPFGSSVVLAVAPVANSAHVPIISASATADGISDAGDYVFRIVPANARQGADDATFAYNRLNARKAVIIYQNNDYGVSLRDAFATRFQELGGQVLDQEGFELGATDYRSGLTKVQARRPDVVFFPLHSQEGTLLLRQAREQNVSSTFVSGDGAMTSELLSGAGPAAEGAYFSTLALGFGVADQQIDAFTQAYIAKYGPGEPDVYAAYYYEAAKIAAHALETAGPDPEQVKNALYAMNGDNAFVGVTGRTAFDSNGEVDKRFYLYQVRDGAFVRVETQ